MRRREETERENRVGAFIPSLGEAVRRKNTSEGRRHDFFRNSIIQCALAPSERSMVVLLPTKEAPTTSKGRTLRLFPKTPSSPGRIESGVRSSREKLTRPASEGARERRQVPGVRHPSHHLGASVV